MPRTDFLFPSFTKGLVNGMANDTAPIEGLKLCKNVDFGQAPMGGITLRPPTVERPDCTLPLDSLAPGKILRPRWLFRFRGYENDNWPYVLVGRQGAVLMNPELTEASEVITFGENVYTDSRWAAFDENKVFFLGYLNYPSVMEKNGGNLSVRPMGVRARWDMVSAGSGGNVDVGTHHYQVITVDEFGNRSSVYTADDSYIAIDTSASDIVTLSNISVGGSGDKKYIYRTKANTSIDDPDNPRTFYYVKAMDDEATTVTDSASDESIAVQGILLDFPSYPPNDLAFAEVHNGVMWGFRRNESILRYTNQFGYEQWPVNNQIPIGDPDYLTAVMSVGDHLLIFKKNKVYAFWGSNINNFDYREVSNIHGTRYIDTIKSIGGSRAIFLDSQRRVMMYNGGNFTEISKPIKIPMPAWYTATLYRDYYVLWVYLPRNVDPEGLETGPLPIVDYFRNIGPWFEYGHGGEGGGHWGDGPGGGDGGGGGGDYPDPGGGGSWDPFEDVRREWDPDIPGVIPGDPSKGPDSELPPPGWRPPITSGRIAAFAYHIPTGAWSYWDDLQMMIPEKPDRSVDNFVFWNGVCPEILGKASTEEISRYPEFNIRTVDTDCGASNQEKSFKEIEIYLEYRSPKNFNGVMGQLELFIDEGTESVWQQPIAYDTDNPQKRWKYRIPNGKNGTRVSIRFVGNQNMNRFSLMGGRLWWEPRATPRRNA